MRLLCYSKLFAVVSIENSLTSTLFIKRDRSIDHCISISLSHSASCIYVHPSRSYIFPKFHFILLLYSTHTHTSCSPTHTHTHHINLSFCLPNCLSLSLSLSLSLAVSLYLSVSLFRCRCCWRHFVCVCVYCTSIGLVI